MTFNSRNELINSIVTLFSLVIICLPLFGFIIVKKMKHKLKDQNFIDKFGGFFENLNLECPYAIYYNCVFLSKRLIVSFAIVFLGGYTVI